MCAKVSVCSPSNQSPCHSLKNLVLKQDHLNPGDCVSADHYFSSVQGRLLHTFGQERTGYTCGSLFVDHASGKVFNFPQYSTNASETVWSTQRLASMARDNGITIKSFHADNGILQNLNSRTTVNVIASSFLFVELERSTRMALPSETSRPLLNGQGQICFILQHIGPYMQAQLIGRQLIMRFGSSTVCLT